MLKAKAFFDISTMFHTLTDVQLGKAVNLQQCIDNRSANLRIGLRSFSHYVGWYNTLAGETFEWWEVAGQTNTICITPGLYSLDALVNLLRMELVTCQLEVSTVNGIVKMTIPNGYECRLSAGLLSLLGLDDYGWLDAGIYVGDRPLDFSYPKALYIHLDQLSTTNNMVDGAPSSLLAIIPMSLKGFGEVNTIYYSNPEFRLLQCGTIDELKLRITDSYGQSIDNHGLPFTAVLQLET
jgi:hypothetical protein